MFFSRTSETKISQLSHSNMTDLCYKYCISRGLSFQTLIIKNSLFTTQSVYYFFDEKTTVPIDSPKETKETKEVKEEASSSQRFVVFCMSRDQNNIREDTLGFLPLPKDIIKSFYEKYPTETATLLLPMHQCGMYLGLDNIPFIDYLSDVYYFGMTRDHCVLLEINPTDKVINIHDSQSSIKNSLYAHSMNVEGFKTQYIPYGKQEDSNLCGYYVYSYILSCLKHRETSQLKNIQLNLEKIKSRENYLTHWESIALAEEVKASPERIKKPIEEADEEWVMIPTVYATEQRKLSK